MDRELAAAGEALGDRHGRWWPGHHGLERRDAEPGHCSLATSPSTARGSTGPGAQTLSLMVDVPT